MSARPSGLSTPTRSHASVPPMPSRRAATRRRCDRELELDLDLSFQGDTMPHHRVVVISIDGFAAFYWGDPQARLPTLRALADRGAVAAGVETVFPSTTWPTHASLMTGVSPRAHGVVANHVFNRATRVAEDLTGDPVYDASDLLRAPTVYDLAHAAGLRTAAIDWPATRKARGLDFNLPFFKDQRVFETQTAGAVWAELAALGYPLDRQGEW